MSPEAVRIAAQDAGLGDFAADYADRYALPAMAVAPARDWARLSLRGAERHRGAFSALVWQGILGFRLTPGAAGTLVGWRIEEETPTRFTMAADGRLMAGRLVFEVGSDVVWTTALRFHGSLGRRIWTVVGAVHRAAVPTCIHAASNSLVRHATQP